MEYYKKTAPLIGYYHAKGLLRGSTGWPRSTTVADQIAGAADSLIGLDAMPRFP
jgi:adenylate kinase